VFTRRNKFSDWRIQSSSVSFSLSSSIYNL